MVCKYIGKPITVSPGYCSVLASFSPGFAYGSESFKPTAALLLHFQVRVGFQSPAV